MRAPANILTIAGSDSGGGAGIQADLKSVAALEGYGMSVITALTAQNTVGVTAIHPAPADFVRQQLDAVLGDIPVHAAKTGMLYSAEIIAAVAQALEGRNFPLVVDPVAVSQTGHRLLQEDAVRALVELLLPGADLLTPNLPEAELLVGMKIESEEDRLTAMRGLLSMGARAVLLKGGHMEGESAVDRLLTSDGRERVFAAPRVETRHTHGTGCTLSAAVAAGLGQGMELEAAVARAKDYLTLGLRAAYPLGKGCGPPHHLALKLREKMRGEILEGLAEAGERIIGLPNMKALIPEVRMNIGAALPFAETSEDVAAFAGRITCTSDGRVVVPGCPAFGASSHIARVILAAGRVVPDISCAANLRYSEEILSTLERNGLAVAWFDRAEEPAEVKAREGGTLEWGTLAALSSHDAPERVRAVCDKGEVGKEPMIRLLAGSLAELMRDMDSLARAL